MSNAPVLDYVAPGKSLTSSDIERDIGGLGISAFVRLFRTLPERISPLPSLVVLDLDGINPYLPPPPSNAFLPPRSFAVLPCSTAVPASWVPIIRRPELDLLLVPGSHPGVHPQAAVALRIRLHGLRADFVEAINARSHYRFSDMKDILEALLSDPAGIRSPSDLARTMRISLGQLQQRCASLQLTRLEHVLTAIRMIAVEYLVSECRVSVREAFRLVGIRDRSNFRRQWRRARYLLTDTLVATEEKAG